MVDSVAAVVYDGIKDEGRGFETMISKLLGLQPEALQKGTFLLPLIPYSIPFPLYSLIYTCLILGPMHRRRILGEVERRKTEQVSFRAQEKKRKALGGKQQSKISGAALSKMVG